MIAGIRRLTGAARISANTTACLSLSAGRCNPAARAIAGAAGSWISRGAGGGLTACEGLAATGMGVGTAGATTSGSGFGAGGAGVSAVAEVLHRRGRRVSGSDASDTPVTRRLAGLGIPVALGHRAENVPAGTGLLVRSAAVPVSNVEVRHAEAAGIPVCSYAEALGRLMEGTCGVAVAGTHGKSTTTAWIAWRRQ